MDDFAQHDFGLLRREVKDARAIASNIDYKLTRLLESDEPDRGGSLVARIACARLLAQIERRQPAEVASQDWPFDRASRALLRRRGPVHPGGRPNWLPS